MISILFFFVKRTRKLPFHYKYSVDRRHMFTFVWNHLIAEHFSERWMPSNKTLIHQSKHSLSTNIPQELAKQIFICDLFAYRGQHPIVNFEDTFYLFLFFSLFNSSSTIYRFLERKGFMKRYDTKVFLRAIFKLYPSIVCLEEKRFRLQVETVSGRLPWRLSRAGCIIHVFQRGSTWESFLLRSCISRLIYKADYWQRFLSSQNTDDSSRISRVNSFFFEKNEVLEFMKKKNEYRIMNRWNVISDGIIGQRRI